VYWLVQITAPVGLDFGFCTVNEESARTFELVNVGQVHTPLYEFQSQACVV
jgi:hypothetical protein